MRERGNERERETERFTHGQFFRVKSRIHQHVKVKGYHTDPLPSGGLLWAETSATEAQCVPHGPAANLADVAGRYFRGRKDTSKCTVLLPGPPHDTMSLPTSAGPANPPETKKLMTDQSPPAGIHSGAARARGLGSERERHIGKLGSTRTLVLSGRPFSRQK
ncbi:hypothetical protein JZ751_015289 [Albula glossodonta]|uniref:Uncharacterized protein n=1 Tax=Albula glossodonta TaxID=121402 RepID=A0A8T2NVD0_9TELE|nr:hypothetical protein JZ751_015289 [Albula glossodonta]